MPKYRIKHRYPCYVNGGCIPHDGYFVQKLQEGLFTDKWVDIKGFGDRKRYAFMSGAKWQKANLWKPADGDDLPEYEREVVVFTQDFPDNAGMMMVSIGHRPAPKLSKPQKKMR